MSNQTSRIHKIDVGTPPSSLSKDKDWEMVEVRYHDFENLTTTRGEFVSPSPEFTCFGHKWRVDIYPGGATNSADGLVSISLSNRSDKGIKVQFGVAIKDKGRKVKKESLSPYEGEEFAPFGTVGDRQKGWNDFCQRSTVIDSLVDGTLIIEVRIRNIGETTTSPFLPENPIAKNILSMFNDEESADVVFEVCSDESGRNTRKRAKTGTTFHAHRLIIQQCSSPLLKELCKPGGEAASKLSITDVKPEVFKHMLYYVYGGKIAENDMTSNVREIIDAADKYGIVGLKLEAEASFVTSMDITFDNAIGNLLYADATNCALLKEAVVDFLVENGSEAVKKLSFDNVPGHVIPDLLTAMNRGKAQDSTSTDENENDFSTMRVSTLRKRLGEKGLDIDGSREMMIARLEESP